MNKFSRFLSIAVLVILTVTCQLVSTKTLAAHRVTQQEIQNAIAQIIAPVPPPVYTIYTPQEFGLRDPDWDTLSQQIVNLPDIVEKGSELHLLVNGYGGELLTVVKVTDSIERLKKKGMKVNMEVVGSAISGHAALLCVADKVTMTEGSTVVFHDAGDFVGYFNNMITVREHGAALETLTPYYTLLNKCVLHKVLTPSQVEAIKDGKRVIFMNVNGVIYSQITPDYMDDVLSFTRQLAYLVFVLSFILIFIGIAKRM